MRTPLWPFLMLLAFLMCACGGYSSSTQASRTAILSGRAEQAINQLSTQIETENHSEALLLKLERAIARTYMGEHEAATQDLQSADEGLEVLDYTQTPIKDLGTYLYSDQSAPYRPPPFEKAMINLFNMVNYLAIAEWSSARVEARRLAVLNSFWTEGLDQEKQGELQQVRALMHWMNAFTYLVNGDLNLAQKEAETGQFNLPLVPQREAGKAYSPVLILSASGMVPHKIAQHIALGRALLYIGPGYHWSPAERAKLAQIQAQGLVKWLNFPTLSSASSGGNEKFFIDQQSAQPLLTLSLSQLVQEHYKRSQSTLLIAALTRLISRSIVGAISKKVGERAGGSAVGLLVNLLAEGSLSMADKPDTRSWSTLPDQLKLYWLWLPPGDHSIELTNQIEHTQLKLKVKGDGAPLVLTFPRQKHLQK